METIPQEIRLRLLAEQVYAASRLGTWCLAPDGALYATTSPNESDFFGFLKLSGCLDYVRSIPDGCSIPTLLSDSTGMVWMAEHMYQDGSPVLLILFGPVFLSNTSVQSIEKSLQQKQISVSGRLKMIRLMEKVPVIPMPTLNQFGMMLHYAMTGKTIGQGDIMIQTSEDSFTDLSLTSEKTDIERILTGEELILQAMAEGNPRICDLINNSVDLGYEFLSSTGDSLRDGKNTAIIFCALCCRAAVSGGLPTKTAQDMQRIYINRMEACGTITELAGVNKEMVDACFKEIKKYKENPHISNEIQECCSYISSHLLDEFTLEDVAKRAGYTEYYLTRKFYKEIGIHINDYIKDAKVDYAKMLLTATEKSVQEISDSLHFSTRNYFSKVFRGITGMTPVDYRKQRELKPGKK